MGDTFVIGEARDTFTVGIGADGFTVAPEINLFEVGADVTTITVNYGAVSVGGSGSGPALIFSTTGPQAGNRYTDWSDLVAAISEGSTIIVEGTDCVVPAGTWDLRSSGFMGDGANGIGINGHSHLTFADGASITNPARLLANCGVNLVSDSDSHVLTLSGAVSVYVDNDSAITSLRSTPFLLADDGAFALVRFANGSGFLHGATTGLTGTFASLEVSATVGVAVVAFPSGNSAMDDNTIIGGDVLIAVISPAAGVTNAFGPESGLAHSGATVTRVPYSRALNIAYDNTASGMTATDVQDAIDELAASGGGSGDVVGPASSTDGVPALFDGTTGKLLKAGTASQPLDAELTALAGLTSAADKLPYFTGSGTASVTDFSSFARTLLDDADASTMRATLGVGSGGSVATDAIFDAKGDLAVGTGADTAAKLTVGASGQVAMADASASTGLVYGVVPHLGLTRPYIAGKYYAIPRSTTGTTGFAADFIRYLPYIPHARHTFDRLIIYTTATSGGAARMGIYDSDGTNGYPGTLILDAGTVATTAASGERAITISQSLAPGHLYWLAVVFNVLTTCAHTQRSSYSEPQWGEEGALSGPQWTANESYSYAALPATATPTAVNASMPTIWLRAS